MHTTPATPQAPAFLTVRAFSRAISASPSYVRAAIRAGRVRAINLTLGSGARAEWRIPTSEIQRLLDEATATPPASVTP